MFIIYCVLFFVVFVGNYYFYLGPMSDSAEVGRGLDSFKDLDVSFKFKCKFQAQCIFSQLRLNLLIYKSLSIWYLRHCTLSIICGHCVISYLFKAFSLRFIFFVMVLYLTCNFICLISLWTSHFTNVSFQLVLMYEAEL